MSKIIYDKPELKEIGMLTEYGAVCGPLGSSATGPPACAAGGMGASCLNGTLASGGFPASCADGGGASCFAGAGAL